MARGGTKSHLKITLGSYSGSKTRRTERSDFWVGWPNMNFIQESTASLKFYIEIPSGEMGRQQEEFWLFEFNLY